jgi:hypothetical protein
MLIRCTWEEVDLDGDYGSVDSVMVTCPRCGHETESFGTDTPSLDRCLVLLREECPREESNFYILEDE